MKREIISEKSFGILCGIGGVLHYLDYHLELITLRNESVMWFSMVIPAIVSGTYLIIKMQLLSDKTYREVQGARRQLFKAWTCISMLLAAVAMFGGYLNFIVLGSNYLVTYEEKIKSFDVLEITSSKPGLKKRTSKRVPLIRFSDGKLIDEVELIDVNFEDFDKDISKIEIVSAKGLWGLWIVRRVQVY